MVTIKINGESKQFDKDVNVAKLLDELTLTGQRLAMEINEELVPRSQFETYQLNDGDSVEIVHAIGGG